jgi:hypothetical protein
MRTHLSFGRLLLLVLLPVLLLIVALAAACGDDGGGPDVTASPSPVPEPTAQGEDDESQIRLTLELFAYYIDNERFDEVCGLYTEYVITAIGCERVKGAFTGVSGGGDVSASLRSVEQISVDGDQGSATYFMCLDVGSGPSCETITVQVLKEAGNWKIGSPQ